MVRQATLGQDVLLAVIEHIQRLCQHLAAGFQLVPFLVVGGLVGVFVFQPVLPLHRPLAFGADRGVQGRIPARHTAVHGDDFGFSHTKVRRDTFDVIGVQVAFFQRADAVLGLAQIEEQFFLARGRAQFHQRPGPQDIFLDRGADPPHGVGRQTEAFFRIEAFDRLHQADVGF